MTTITAALEQEDRVQPSDVIDVDGDAVALEPDAESRDAQHERKGVSELGENQPEEDESSDEHAIAS